MCINSNYDENSNNGKLSKQHQNYTFFIILFPEQIWSLAGQPCFGQLFRGHNHANFNFVLDENTMWCLLKK